MSTSTSAKPVHDVEVLIVGAGPTGLVAANLLGQAGIRALLVEQNDTLSKVPKALLVDDEFFRLLHTLHLSDELAAHGLGPVGFDYFSPLGPRVGHVAGRITENGFPSRTAIFQPEFEHILCAGLVRYPNVAVSFGQELTSFSEHSSGIDAVTRNAAGTQTRIHARYLIAADGSHSFCRKALGIAFEELAPVEVRHAVIDVADDPNTSKTAELKLGWRCSGHSLPTPVGRRRYEFSLQAQESAEQILSDAALEGLFRQFFRIGRPRNIIRKTVYAFHSRLVTQMSKGRVFLAGDAAHIMPVIGSQGMNSGARDVNNLAWKLVLALRAKADPSILDTYDIERRPQVAGTIRAVTAAMNLQKSRSVPATIARDVAAILLNLLPPVARYLRDMRYIPKPFLRGGLIAAQTRSGEASFVGRVLPLPLVRHGDVTSLLDDVLGTGFAILGVEPDALPAGADDPLWRTLGAQLTVVSRDADYPQRLSGVTISSVVDSRFNEVFAAHCGQWLVVRPDRIVAAAVDTASFVTMTQFFSDLYGVYHSLVQAAE